SPRSRGETSASACATRDCVARSRRSGGYAPDRQRVPSRSPPHTVHARRRGIFAIQSIARGEIFLSPVISKHVIEAYLSRSADKTASIEILTPRQREILQLIAEGHSNKQIAKILKSSTKTIDSHRANIM